MDLKYILEVAFVVMVVSGSIFEPGQKDDMFMYFGTKSSYEQARKFAYLSDINSEKVKEESGNCEVIFVDGIIRHGTRNPGKKDIFNFQNFLRRVEDYALEFGASSSSHSDILYTKRRKLFGDDVFPNGTLFDKLLREKGVEELNSIGRFIKQLFPKISQNSEEISFITSNTQRTIHSCLAFQDGLGLRQSYFNGDRYVLDDKMIRFYDYCEKYLEAVVDNDTSQLEPDSFKVGPEMMSVMTKIQDGLKRNQSTPFLPIFYKDLKALYNVAACEYAIYGTSSFAPMFSARDLLILEYAADQRSFWKRGYGHEINYVQSCSLLQQIYEYMNQATLNRTSAKKGVFRFGHAETLVPLMSLLGLYRDPLPLNADNFHLHSNRAFRSSRIMPFAANLFFMLYKCPSSVEHVDKERNSTRDEGVDFKVVVFHNERPIYLPACPTELMCPLVRFERYYWRWLRECDTQKVCSLQNDLHVEL